MTNLIDQYQALHTKIKERVLYINNMLYGVALPDHLKGYSKDFCGVEIDELHMKMWGGYITLTHYPPYDDYEDKWEVLAGYVDMDDATIITEYLSECERKWQVEKKLILHRLQHDAKVFGYTLTEKDTAIYE